VKINPKRRTRQRAAQDPPALNIQRGLGYPGGYQDEHIESFAHEDGQAAVHNPAVWGENNVPHAIHAFIHGHDTNASLIGHDVRGRLQTVYARLRALIPQAKTTEQNALDDVEGWRTAQIEQAELAQEIKDDGLAIPDRFTLVWIVLALLALFFGDLAIISLSFEVFRLSDKPLVPGLKLTNELHLAAVTSVTALLILAHVAGYKLLLIAHAVGRRRKAITPEAKEELPRPSWIDAAIAVGCVVVAWYVLQALSAIRVDYLRSRGVQSQPGPFLYLQAGIFLAAAVLSYHLSHPYARKWADAGRRVKRATAKQKSSEELLGEQTGKVNEDIDLLGTLLGQAGHHVGVSESNVNRQDRIYARRVILSQPEPTTERLFPETLPGPVNRLEEELKKFLIGVTALPTFEYLNTDKVTARREEVREELVQLADNLRTKATIKPSGNTSTAVPGSPAAGTHHMPSGDGLDRKFVDLGRVNGDPTKASPQ